MGVHQLHPDGIVREAPDVSVSVEDPGFTRGEAVFETLTVAHGAPLWLGAHLDRLERSAAAMGIHLPPRDALGQLASAGASGTCVLRLVATRGGSVLALTGPVPDHGPARRDGVTAITLDLGVPVLARAGRPWLLGGVKTTSYAVAMAGRREAERRGADDAIWLSTEGEVLESTTANVAWVRNGVLATPPAAEVGILAGVTIAWALRQVDVAVEVRRGSATELFDADEVLLTSSVRGVVGVRRIDGRTIGAGEPGPTTVRLVRAFDELLGIRSNPSRDGGPAGPSSG